MFIQLVTHLNAFNSGPASRQTIRRLRIDHGIGLRALARAAGLNPGQLFREEKKPLGKLTVARLSVLLNAIEQLRSETQNNKRKRSVRSNATAESTGVSDG